MPKLVPILLLLLLPGLARAQACPPNIGFEDGTFTNWQCFAGGVGSNGDVTVGPTAPLPDRHVILKNTYPQQLDPYGRFPVNAPNGSNYSIRLGNSQAGAEAERVSYTFTIPVGRDLYSIIYNYAVVLENPSHAAYQQPKFTANVYNVTDDHYIDCGSFSFVASGSLPGFQLSPYSKDVFFKPWSPVTIKLVGLAGKTIRLEFTTNDCTQGAHFGYAYLDVVENCTSPISGNVYCDNARELLLTAPYGFENYRWYTADFSTILSRTNTLQLAPPPAPGTVYALEVQPYPGLGCVDTLYTTIQKSPAPFDFVVIDSLKACGSYNGVDLTADSITAGSSPGMTFSYFMDANELNYVATPAFVDSSGVYYIRAQNSAGCNELKPVTVNIVDMPVLKVTNPPLVCPPAKADLTAAAVTAGTTPANSVLSYWTDLNMTIALPHPGAMDAAGRYYIRAEDMPGCYSVQQVDVAIGTVPDFTVNDQADCGNGDLTVRGVAVSSMNVTYTYWQDAAAGIPLPAPDKIATSNTYYIKASTADGCSLVKPVHLVVNPLPVFTVASPAPVSYPTTVDLTTLPGPVPSVVYSYWQDAAATKPVADPAGVNTGGTYYIKGTDANGCVTIKPVNVLITAKLFVPSAFSPNGDGRNDVLHFIARGGLRELYYFKIFDRWGHEVFGTQNAGEGWDGTLGGQPQAPGVYVWVIKAADWSGVVFEQKGTVVLVK